MGRLSLAHICAEWQRPSTMALGFAFNKAKILSAAEKYVQQGKLQNAIAEYEKVSKQDPKDLTVLNTIGDLYARLGRSDRATEFFRRVGDAYASDGFVVKAIAMYKKLTKLGATTPDALVRLADLYTQQGLYHDARTQYMAVADQYLKNNDKENAAGILKKMLDLDPENAAMQTKVADLYQKLGRNQEALDIYFHSAQALFQRGSKAEAEEALRHVLKIDPKYEPALLLRGQIAATSGKSDTAIANLAKLQDLDARPEALRPLLQAYISSGEFDKAEPIVDKLVTTHHDSSTVASYSEALLAADRSDLAVALYEKYADKFLAENKQEFLQKLTTLVSKIKESEASLQSMLALLRKSDAPAHAVREVQELLANVYVQHGELQAAADLYQDLAHAEPENPLHEQNYKQIISRMGTDAATRELSSEEAGQAFMLDELEGAPAVVQEYSRDVAEEITSALTDSELFASYNVPEKAVVPLEKVLAKAPNDVRVRQRLAALYARLGRFADAAACCKVLSEVHAVAGNTDQAKQFRDIGARYEQQAGGAAPSAALTPVEAPVPTAAIEAVPVEPIPFQASSVVNVEVERSAPQPTAAADFEIAASAPVQEAPVQAEAPAPAKAAPPEAEHGEWEDMLTVETPAASVQEVTAQDSPDEIVEEARFYIDQGMFAEAKAAIARLESSAPNHPTLAELRKKSTSVEAPAPAVSAPLEASSAKPATKAAPAVVQAPEVRKPAAPQAAPQQEQDEEVFADLLAEPIPAEAPKPTPKPVISPAPAQPKTAAAAASASEPAVADDPLSGLLSDLEDALGEIAPPATSRPAPTVAKGPTPRVPEPRPVAASPALQPVAHAASAAVSDETSSMLSDLLHEFKEEIEEPAAEADDPETHYNLGVAFREMGLLDEAIGELQKVCRSLDNGHSFSQSIQAYTWLAQCLVDKGAPQAAIRWYERALGVKGINDDSRLAVYYDMANAFESAGNKKAALDNFMQVYGSNIDYRDVADRIRSLSK